MVKEITSLFRMDSRGLIIRVWRREDELKDRYDNTDVAQKVNLLHDREMSMSHVANVLSNMPRVLIVEVIYRHGYRPRSTETGFEDGVGGDGVCIYNRE